jgi:2-amino-4-hydroxy-6-hydroxymethyldihydropteridine diphosphokinase
MSLVFIALGSNIGAGRANLQQAWKMLGKLPGVTPLALSSPYRTRPEVKIAWEKEGRRLSEQWFTNAAGALETRLSPEELLAALQRIEAEMGRDRQESVDRTVDLDILYVDELVVNGSDLVLPHPELQNRQFVLAPLEEIAPDRSHPVSGLTTRQMRRQLPPPGDDIQQIAWQQAAVI